MDLMFYIELKPLPGEAGLSTKGNSFLWNFKKTSAV